jgi:hypothetical protein
MKLISFDIQATDFVTKYPQIIAEVLPQAKNGDEKYRNFMQPMGRLNMHSKCFDFLGGDGGRGGGEGGNFYFIFPLFPSSSQWVPNVFPQGVFNSTLL